DGRFEHGKTRLFNCPGWKYYLLTLLCFTLGLMSKPMLVTLPLLLLLLDFWPLQRVKPVAGGATLNLWTRLLAEKWPMFLLATISCVITFLAQRAEAVATVETYPLTLRLTNAIVSYARYLLKTIWPANLAVLYPLPDHWPWSDVATAA